MCSISWLTVVAPRCAAIVEWHINHHYCTVEIATRYKEFNIPFQVHVDHRRDWSCLLAVLDPRTGSLRRLGACSFGSASKSCPARSALCHSYDCVPALLLTI